MARNAVKVTERVIIERVTECHYRAARDPVGASAPPRLCAGDALEAGLASGALYIDGAVVRCSDGREAYWRPCCGVWRPVDVAIEADGFQWL